MARKERRSGFTLIELLIVVSVIGLLVALLLPAVQSSRAAARRIQCSNNLKNIGLAIQNHAEAHGKFPAGVGKYPADVSFLVQILPQIEQAALYNSINVADGVQVNGNLTAYSQAPGLYACPSDATRSTVILDRPVNYAGNAGRTLWDGEGVFINKPLSPRDITDGLSQTAGVSEWIAGMEIGGRVRENTFKFRLLRLYADTATDAEAFARDCEALAAVSDGRHISSKGMFWLDGALDHTLYNHTMTPGKHSCSAFVNMDATTVGSYHGGVNVLMMDGSVRLVKTTISRPVWLAAGTRAGGEVGSSLD